MLKTIVAIEAESNRLILSQKETKTEKQRGFLRCKKNFDEPLVSKLPDDFISFTHSIHDKVVKQKFER